MSDGSKRYSAPMGDRLEVELCACGCNTIKMGIFREEHGPDPITFVSLDPEEAKNIGEALIRYAAKAGLTTASPPKPNTMSVN